MRNPDATLAGFIADPAMTEGDDPSAGHRGQFARLDRIVIAGFYALVTVAACAFAVSWWRPRLDADDYMAVSWSCIFGAALCLLTRLAVLVLEDVGERQPVTGVEPDQDWAA